MNWENPVFLFSPCVSPMSPLLLTPNTDNTSDDQMCGWFSPHHAILMTSTGCPTISLNRETIYLEVVSHPTG